MKYCIVREESVKPNQVLNCLEEIVAEHEGYRIEKIDYKYSELELVVDLYYLVPVFKVGDAVRLKDSIRNSAQRRYIASVDGGIVEQTSFDQVKIEGAGYIPAKWLVHEED